MDEEERVRTRVLLALEQYAQEVGRGWQTKLAKASGVHQTHISKLSKGDRGTQISDATVGKLAKGLKVPRSFFYDPALGPRPNYRDFVGVRQIDTSDQQRAVVREWLASAEGRLATEDQAQRLLSIDWGGVTPTARMVRSLWLEMDAEDRGRALPDGSEDQAPDDLGNKRRLR